MKRLTSATDLGPVLFPVRAGVTDCRKNPFSLQEALKDVPLLMKAALTSFNN